MHALTAHPEISPADRLSVTIVFAVLAHLIFILGVTFVREDRSERRVATLDVVLMPLRAEAAPDHPDYLSQANQDGGGDNVEKVRPEAPPPTPLVEGEPAMAASIAAGAPVRTEEAPRDIDTTSNSVPAPTSISPPVRISDTAPLASRSRSREIAALSAEIERKLRKYAQRPRRKWISARTREHEFAVYMDAWRRKVEQVGNLNYPDEAVRRRLSGSLLLEVALNPDGTVENIALRRSSGRHILDAAAVRIVRLAAPFARFPDGIAEEVDILHIQRTWIFHSGNRFTSP